MKQTDAQDKLVYRVDDNLYINVTQLCTADCIFCLRDEHPEIFEHDLRQHAWHAPEAYVPVFEHAVAEKTPREVVFCGFGEPTLRLDVVQTVAACAKKLGLRVRLNTNGHGSLILARPLLPSLEGLVDAVSVSLNAPDGETYERLVRPHPRGAFLAVQAFIREAVELGFDVTATAVACLPDDQIAATRELALSLGAKFRLRELW